MVGLLFYGFKESTQDVKKYYMTRCLRRAVTFYSISYIAGNATKAFLPVHIRDYKIVHHALKKYIYAHVMQFDIKLSLILLCRKIQSGYHTVAEPIYHQTSSDMHLQLAVTAQLSRNQNIVCCILEVHKCTNNA